MTASPCLSAECVSTSSRWTVYITSSFCRLSVFTLIPPSVYPLIFFSPLPFFLQCCPARLFVSLYILSHESLFQSAICFSVFPPSGSVPLVLSRPGIAVCELYIVSTCCKLRAASDWARSRSPCVRDLGITAGPERCQRRLGDSLRFRQCADRLAGVRWK